LQTFPFRSTSSPSLRLRRSSYSFTSYNSVIATEKKKNAQSVQITVELLNYRRIYCNSQWMIIKPTRGIRMHLWERMAWGEDFAHKHALAEEPRKCFFFSSADGMAKKGRHQNLDYRGQLIAQLAQISHILNSPEGFNCIVVNPTYNILNARRHQTLFSKPLIKPHSSSFQPNPISECGGCMSTPNSKTFQLASFIKQHGCRLHSSTWTSSDKANILAELNALQERCSTLAFALAESSLTTPHHQDGPAPPSPRPIDDGVATYVNPNDTGLNSGTGPIVTGPEGWGVSFAGGLDAYFIEQTSQAPFGHALPATGVLGSEASMLNQETQPEDHAQLDAFFGNHIETEFQDVFDFNAASLPLGFDVQGSDHVCSRKGNGG
jgi:hypothetical protein